MSADTPHSASQFERVFHHIDDAVVEFEIVEDEPIIVDANHAFRDIFSPDMKRVIGLPLNDLIVPADKQAEAAQFDQRTSAGRSNVAFVERTATDGERTFLYRGIPYDENHGFAIYTDVTGELQRQAELSEIIALAEELLADPVAVDTVDVASTIKTKAETLARYHDHPDL